MEREGGGGGKSSSCRGWRVARNVSKRLARQRSGGSCTDCHQQQQRQSSKSRAIDLLIQPSRLRPNPKGPPTIPYSSHHRFQPSKQKRLAKKRRRSWKKREWNGSSDQGEFEASFTPFFLKKKKQEWLIKEEEDEETARWFPFSSRLLLLHNLRRQSFFSLWWHASLSTQSHGRDASVHLV